MNKYFKKYQLINKKSECGLLVKSENRIFL